MIRTITPIAASFGKDRGSVSIAIRSGAGGAAFDRDKSSCGNRLLSLFECEQMAPRQQALTGIDQRTPPTNKIN
jgi:hypothetical protein